jgi:hypothetical protein
MVLGVLVAANAQRKRGNRVVREGEVAVSRAMLVCRAFDGRWYAAATKAAQPTMGRNVAARNEMIHQPTHRVEALVEGRVSHRHKDGYHHQLDDFADDTCQQCHQDGGRNLSSRRQQTAQISGVRARKRSERRSSDGKKSGTRAKRGTQGAVTANE